MLEKFKEMLRTQKKGALEKPRHIAITLNGMKLWTEENKKPIEESYKLSFDNIKETIEFLVKENIPIVTFYVLPEYMKKDTPEFSKLLDAIIDFMKQLVGSEIITKNRIKLSVLGKWYSLPGRVVDVLKTAIDSTKDYDNYFVNFCVNYNGQEEVVDACKMIARQIKSGKLDPEAIDKELIKENLYSSFLLPPDLIIKNGVKKRTNGFMLWDSTSSTIYFSEKLWPDFSKKDMADALDEFSK